MALAVPMDFKLPSSGLLLINKECKAVKQTFRHIIQVFLFFEFILGIASKFHLKLKSYEPN